MTFRDLCEKLWGLQGDERAFIGQAAREALIDELLAEVDLAGSAKSLRTAGGRRFLAELAQVHAGSDKQDHSGRLSSLLAPFIDAYDVCLKERALIEPDAALLELADRKIFADAGYGLLGFMDFPPAQRAYVEMLMSVHIDVAIAVTCETTGDATQEGRRFAADLEMRHLALMGQEASVIQVAIDPQNAAEKELAALRAGFLCDDVENREPVLKLSHPVLRFEITQGEDAEVVTAVQAAQSALSTVALQREIASSKEEPLQWGQREQDGQRGQKGQQEDEEPTDDAPVALVFRHLGPVITRLARALDYYHIPAAFDVKVPFRQAGLGAALCALLQLPTAGDDLVAVASDYLLSAYSGKTQLQAAEIEQRLREGRPGYGAYSLRLCSQLGVPELHHLTAEAWAQLATELLFRGEAVQRSDYLRQLDFAAHKSFLSQLAEQRELELGILGMRSSSTGTEVESPRLDSLKILAGLATVQVNLTPPPGSTQLLVSEASRVRGRQFHTVILAGLAQQDFAAMSEPSFSERTIAQLTGHTEPDKLAGEHQLWYDLIGCARQSAILLGQDRDLSGKELAPSVLLEELRALMPSQSIDFEAHTSEDIVPNKDLRDCELRLFQTNTALGSAKARRLLAADPDAAPCCPVRGQLTGLDFGSHAKAPFAVTTLEYYARCPYSWFLSHHVARKSIRDNRDALNEGLILHATLQRFYQRTSTELGEAHVRADTLPQARQLLDRCFDAAWQGTLKVDSIVQLSQSTQVSLEALREALHGFLADEASWMPGFTPRYFEQKFGEGEDWPAGNIAGVAVRGAIDRIDVYGPRMVQLQAETKVEVEVIDTPGTDGGLFFIIDYKRTGAKNGGQLKTRITNKEIQATVYGLVAAHQLAPLRYAGSSYRNIMNPKDLKIEHPTSLRKQYWEQMGFPEKASSAPQSISDERKKGEPSAYETGIAHIEAIVASAAARLAAGDATIAVPLDKDGIEKSCPFSSFCFFSGCGYYKRKNWS